MIDFSGMPTKEWRRFEDLICDLLEKEGLYIAERGGVGVDEGRDILAVGYFANSLERMERKYLVSCKYWSKPVPEAEVTDILDKVKQHGADGFLLAAMEITSGLQKKLDGLRSELPVSYWLRRDIENRLIEHKDVFRKYLRDSFDRFFGVEGLVPEGDLISLYKSRYGRNPKPNELFSWRKDTVVHRIADVNEIKRALDDKKTLEVLNSLYHELLDRKVDPVGHLTWGYRLFSNPGEETKRSVEFHIRNSDEYLARSRFLYVPDSFPKAELRFKQPLIQGFYGWRPYHVNYSDGILRTAPSVLPPQIQLESAADKEFRLEWRLGRNIPNKGFLALDVGFEGSFQVFVLLLGANRKPYYLQYIFDDGEKRVEDSGMTYAQHFVGRGFPFDDVVPKTLERNMNQDLMELCQTTVSSIVSIMFGVKGKAKIARIYLTAE